MEFDYKDDGITFHDNGGDKPTISQNSANLDRLAAECYRISTNHGFHKKYLNVAEQLCLIHSEVSEALEAYRDDDIFHYADDGKPDGVLSELADVVIRVLDLVEAMNNEQPKWRSFSAIVAQKMAYNENRPVGHGRVRL